MIDYIKNRIELDFQFVSDYWWIYVIIFTPIILYALYDIFKDNK